MTLSSGRLTLISLLLTAVTFPVFSYAADVTATTSASALYRQARPIIGQSLPTPLARTWANSRIGLYTDTLKYIQKLRDSRMDAYAGDVGRDAAKYLSDIQSGVYTFDISASERDSVEKNILAYQQELVSYMRLTLEKARTLDYKETGDTHFTLRMKDISLDIHVDRYAFTQSNDLTNKELDGKIRIRASGEELDGDIEIMFDGKVVLIKNDIYFTLRDYTLISPSTETWVKSMKTILTGLKGKTYHQSIDRDIVEMLDQSEKGLELMDTLLSTINTESLLTPIAKIGDEYVLMLRRSTVDAISDILTEGDIESFTLDNVMIPVDMRMAGNRVTMNGYIDNTHIRGTLDRDTESKKALLTLKGEVHDMYSHWNWELSRTAGFWGYASATDEYTIAAKASDTSVTASVKKGEKTILSARMDTTGIDAWSYDLTAIWEYMSYDWDTDESSSADIVMHLWGKVKQEFGTFVLVPPTIYEELENSVMRKIERDTARKNDLENISWTLAMLDKYPSAPKNGCVTSIPLRSYGWSRFSYYTDEKGLGAGTCSDGYYYRLTTDADNNPVYILAARVETTDTANYDSATLDITRASYDDILAHISTGTLDESRVLYHVVTSDDTTYDTYWLDDEIISE